MHIEVDYLREVITVNGYDVSFSMLELFTTGHTPGPWARVVRRNDRQIIAERMSPEQEAWCNLAEQIG